MTKTQTPPPTLLTYAIDTVPDPLQVSPKGGDPVMGVLTLIVSNGTHDIINLWSLTITLPVGDDGKDLTSDARSIMVNVDPERLWVISETTTTGQYIIQPAGGGYIPIAGTGVVFQFFNIPINETPGTVPVDIGEIAATTTTQPLIPNNTNLNVTKFPYGFFFNNLVPSVPAVKNGGTVTLTWQGSTQARYFMLYNDQQVDVSNVRSWESPALTRDTTFLLKALSESNQVPVERGLCATVNVMNPDITASSLNVSGDTSMTGALTVNGNSTAASLNVTGGATVNGSLNTTGGLTATGGANGSTIDNLKVGNIFSARNGSINVLTVSGPSALNDVQVKGSLTGDLAITGNLTVQQDTQLNGNLTVQQGTRFNGITYASTTFEAEHAAFNTMTSNFGNIINMTAHTYSVGDWSIFQNSLNNCLSGGYQTTIIFQIPPVPPVPFGLPILDSVSGTQDQPAVEPEG